MLVLLLGLLLVLLLVLLLQQILLLAAAVLFTVCCLLEKLIRFSRLQKLWAVLVFRLFPKSQQANCRNILSFSNFLLLLRSY